MPKRKLDQFPDLRQLALAAPDVVIADLVQTLVVVPLRKVRKVCTNKNVTNKNSKRLQYEMQKKTTRLAYSIRQHKKAVNKATHAIR